MLQAIVDWLVYSVFRLSPESEPAGMINFFIYDSLKILLLLLVMISFIGFLRTFLPQHKVKQVLIRKKGWGNLLASLFGSVTPFCSCSSIPIFLSFLEAGVPLGVTFSFLITSPLINEYLVVLMLGFFGWKITILYVISGIIIGTTSGIILGRMNLSRYIVKGLFASQSGTQQRIKYDTIKQRIFFGITEAVSITKKIWLWVLIAVGIGSVIHNYVPQAAVESAISKTGIFSVPIAVILGTPMYGSCAAIVPIAVALFRKGLPLGTALALMMSIAALSLPEAVILRRAMKLKLIAIFFGITASAIIFTGYLFNLLQKLLV